MATYTAFFNGVDKSASNVLLEGFSIREVTNGINTLVCDVESHDASYRPLKRQTVDVYEDDGSSPVHKIFGGLIKSVRERGFGQPADGIDDIVMSVTADSYRQLAERRFVDAVIPAGTLKAALQVLEPYLNTAPYFVTLDPAQVNGPTLDAIEFKVTRVDDALNFLATLTAKYGAPFTWTISYDKILGMYQTGTVAAPWDLIEGQGTEVGDVEVEPTDDEYANKIILVGGNGQVTSTTDTFIGNGVTNSFPLTYTLTGPVPGVGFGAVGQGIVIVNGITQTLAEVGLGYAWEYDPVTNSVSQTSGPPAFGTTIVVPYDGQLLFTVIAQDAGEIALYGLWEDKILAPEITDPVLAQSVADAELARRLGTGRIVRFRTRRIPCVEPGQTITITVPKRNISGSFTVTDVATDNEPGGATDDASPSSENNLIRTVTCNNTIHEQEHQTLTRWWSEKDTTGTALPAGSGAAPGPPLYSIQSNRPLGRFFGEGYLLYYSLFFGGGSPDRNGLIFPGVAGDFADSFRAEMGMLDEHGDFSIDVFGPGDRNASPIVEPNSMLVNSSGDIFITSGTAAPNPPVTSPPTEWYWGGVFIDGNDSLTSGYAAAGGFISGGFAPGFQLIPGPYGDSVANFTGFNLLASIGFKFHPIDGIVASLPFTIDTDGVSDTQDYSLYISTAGTGTITLPYVGSAGTPNYHVWPVTGAGRALMIVNESSGTLTVSGGGATINGDASIDLGPYSAVVVSRFNVTATGEWAVLASHGSMTGGGGASATAPGGDDKDVQFNDGGVLAGQDEFEWDKTKGQLSLQHVGSHSLLRLENPFGGSPSSAGGPIAMDCRGDGYAEIGFGLELVGGVETAQQTNPAYLWHSDDEMSSPVGLVASGIELLVGETPGSAASYAQPRGFYIDDSGFFHVYQTGGLGTGNKTGCGIQIGHNDSGNGAASFLSLVAKDGTQYYFWVDAAGKFRIGTAPPQEDGTPSDTSGTVVTASGVTVITALAADPGGPSDGDVWVRAAGTTPTRNLELRIRDGGVSYTIASITV